MTARPLTAKLVAAAILAAVAVLVHPSAAADAVGAASLALVAVSAWDVEAGLGILLVFVPLRTVAGFAVPLPLRFVADTVVAVLLLRLVVRHRRTLLPLGWIEVSLAAFSVVGMLLTLRAGAHVSGAVLELRDLMLFPLLYAVVRRLILVGDGPRRDWWARLLPIGLTVIALVGVQGLLALLLVHHPFLVPHRLAIAESHVLRANLGRPNGWLDNPNVFGQLGLFALALTYAHFRAHRFRPVGAFAFLSAVFAAMVVFSFSRSAYLALVLGAVVYAAAADNRRERLAIVTAAAVMLIASVIQPAGFARTIHLMGSAIGPPAVALAARTALPPATAARGATSPAAESLPRAAAGHARPAPAKKRAAGPTAQCTKSSYLCLSLQGGRLRTLVDALRLIRRFPLGTGLGTFGSSGSKVFGITATLQRMGISPSFYADDNYAVVLVETGIIGFLLFFLGGLATFYTLWRLRLRRFDAALVWFLFLSVTLLSFTGDTWEQLNLMLYPWLALAVLYRPARATVQAEPVVARRAARRASA